MKCRALRPELPAEKRARFVADYGVHGLRRELFSRVNAGSRSISTPRQRGHAIRRVWRIGLSTTCSVRSLPRENPSPTVPISAHALDELVNLIEPAPSMANKAGRCSPRCSRAGTPRRRSSSERGLEQGELTPARWRRFAARPSTQTRTAVAEFKAGKAQAINAIKGQVMKLSQGKANPVLVGDIITKMIAG
jgi:aspartyl-tRNA(Asn)/glutamyl-tRNA(Gln) amidotransferase subunit B